VRNVGNNTNNNINITTSTLSNFKFWVGVQSFSFVKQRTKLKLCTPITH